MSEAYVTITPRDPLVARDGRPFGPGSGRRMRSTGWLTPSVAAGSFRTALAKAAGRGFDATTQDELLQAEFAGPFAQTAGELLLPAPSDCVIQRREDGSLWPHSARPRAQREGEGCDWPGGAGLRPVILGDDVDAEFKPETGPSFWPTGAYATWLTEGKLDLRAAGLVAAAKADLRDHVSIDPETGAAAEGLLFTSAGIAAGALPRFNPVGKRHDERFTQATLSARLRHLPAWHKGLHAWHPLGGERRLAHWKFEDGQAKAWECPGPVRSALASTRRVRMTLVTPASFAGGWRPPEVIGGVRLKLVGVCIQRWRAISGWSYKDGGPKAIRRVVPAGGTYFFEVDNEGDAAPLANLWLEPVSEDEQDRRDGFGLAVWGTWEE